MCVNWHPLRRLLMVLVHDQSIDGTIQPSSHPNELFIGAAVALCNQLSKTGRFFGTTFHVF